MAKLPAEMRISDAADWQELLTVMSERMDELPEAVRSGLQKLADGEALVWGPEWVASLGAHGEDVTVEADGKPIERCQYGLPLRRCYRADGGELVPAASFTISQKGKVLAGW